MKKIKFMMSCPACGDAHLGIEAKKPTLLTPLVTKAKCDECESVTMLQLTIPRERKASNEIRYDVVKVFASAQLLAKLALAEIAEEEPTPESNGGPTDGLLPPLANLATPSTHEEILEAFNNLPVD